MFICLSPRKEENLSVNDRQEVSSTSNLRPRHASCLFQQSRGKIMEEIQPDSSEIDQPGLACLRIRDRESSEKWTADRGPGIDDHHAWHAVS